jgi:hypothetical protein
MMKFKLTLTHEIESIDADDAELNTIRQLINGKIALKVEELDELHSRETRTGKGTTAQRKLRPKQDLHSQVPGGPELG